MVDFDTMRAIVMAATLIAALAVPTAALPSGLDLDLANVWSFRVQSKTLLADHGYEADYLFEFVDEEELRVRGSGLSAILEGHIRTILDGDPVEATIHLRGEALGLHIRKDRNLLVAAWQNNGRLTAADLPASEIERRWTAMLTLLQETRRRLGIDGFSPSSDHRIYLPLQAVDVLQLIPAKRTPQQYEIRLPGRTEAVEVLVTEVGGKRWEVTWDGRELRVRTSPPLDPARTLAAVVYRRGRTMVEESEQALPADEAQRLVVKGFGFLESVRTYFGTAQITTALPSRRLR